MALPVCCWSDAIDDHVRVGRGGVPYGLFYSAASQRLRSNGSHHGSHRRKFRARSRDRMPDAPATRRNFKHHYPDHVRSRRQHGAARHHAEIHGDDIAFTINAGPGRLFEGLLVRRSAPDSPAIPDRASPTTRNLSAFTMVFLATARTLARRWESM